MLPQMKATFPMNPAGLKLMHDLLRLYLHGDGALGVALVGQREAERAARWPSLLLLRRRDPPDEEACRRQDGARRARLPLEEQRRAFRVRRRELEDKVLPGKRAQVALRPVERRRLVDWRHRDRSESTFTCPGIT